MPPGSPLSSFRILLVRAFLSPAVVTHGAACLSGLLYFLAFPGVDLWPLAFVAWVPWLVVLEHATPRLALVSGLSLGTVVGVTGFYWLLEHLQTFSGFSTPSCLVLMLLVCVYQGGRFALLGWLYRRGRERAWGAGLVWVVAFAASETVWPMLFPFTFAGTAVLVPPLLQVAELGGQLLVALTLLGPSWALSRLWLWGRSDARTLPALKERYFWGLIVGFGVLPSSAVYGFVRMAQVDALVAHAPKVKVGMVQANMGLMEKRTNFDEGRRRHIEATKKLRQMGAEFVVWSETSLGGAVDEKDAAEIYQRSLTRHLRVPTLFGAVLARPVDDARGYVLFNSALLADKKGKVVGRYDKHFLLAFGEYLPFGDSFPTLYEYSPNSGRFTPGTTLEPVTLGDRQIAVIICYEDIVPSFVNDLMNAGNPELLVNMTNDAWFGDTSEPWEHMALSVFRAVEHRRFFARSTNSGISGFVDPTGRLLARTGTFEEAAIVEELAWLNEKTIFRYVGTKLGWGMSALAFYFAFRRRVKRKGPAALRVD